MSTSSEEKYMHTLGTALYSYDHLRSPRPYRSGFCLLLRRRCCCIACRHGCRLAPREDFPLCCVDTYDTIAVLGTMSRLGHYQAVNVHAMSTSAFSGVAAATSSTAAAAVSPDSARAAGSISPSPSIGGVGASIEGVAGISGVAGRDSSCGSSCTSSCAFAAASTAIADAVADSRGSDTADVASRSAILTVLYIYQSRYTSTAGWPYDMNSPLQKLSESRRTCQSPA